VTMLVQARSRQPRTSRAHAALIEQAVNRYAPIIWGITRRQFQAHLAAVLEHLRPHLKLLTLEQRASGDPEVDYIATLISAVHSKGLEGMGGVIQDVADAVARQQGFLQTDPRYATIVDYTQRILSDDLSAYWQGLQDPTTMAKRIVDLQRQGLGYQETSRRVAATYGAEFYRSERLVRSAYNTSSNYAHYRDLLEAGYTSGRWLTSEDSRVRHPHGSQRWDHRSADGQIRKLGEPFIVTGELLLFPGDRSMGASIGNVINCRCTLIGAD